MNDLDPMNEEKVTRSPRKDKLKVGEGTVENTSRKNRAHENPLRPRTSKAGGIQKYIHFPEHTMDEWDGKNPGGYYYRATIDDGGNVAKRLSMGYEFALADDTGEKCVRFDRGTGKSIYWMRQDYRHRMEDLELKRDANSASIISEQIVGEGQYVPDGRKQVVQKDHDLDPFSR